jgi:hypothetical protein
MNYFVIIIVIIVIIVGKYIQYKYDNFMNEEKEYKFNGELKTKLLTNSELSFYNKLKEIADKHNLEIFIKLRLADIIETKEYSEFNKVKSKHIDFTLCNEYTKPIMFIELDDYTHNYKKNAENDNKKNIIFKSLNIDIERIKISDIDFRLEQINNKLNEIMTS